MARILQALRFIYTHNLGYYVKSSIKREDGACYIEHIIYKEYMLFGKRIKYYYAYCIGAEELEQALKSLGIKEFKRG